MATPLIADDIVFAVVDDLLGRIQGLQDGAVVEFVRSLTAGQQTVWTTFIVVDGEVNNGGFNQLFWNSSTSYVEDAIKGYQLIGADEHLRLLQEAVRRHGVESARIRPYRHEDTLAVLLA